MIPTSLWVMFIVVLPGIEMEMHPFVSGEGVEACDLVERNPGADVYGIRPIETYCFDATCNPSWATDAIRCEKYEPGETWRMVER